MSLGRKPTGALIALASVGGVQAAASGSSERLLRASHAASHHVQRRCKASGAKLVASNRYARVLVLQDVSESAVYACPVRHGKVGRRLTLAEGSQSSQGGDAVAFEALTGPFITIGSGIYYGPSDPRPSASGNAVYDIRHPRQHAVGLGDLGFTLEGASLTAAVAAGRASAWLESGRGQATTPEAGMTKAILHARDTNGVRVLDSGAISPGSISVAAAVVHWVNAGDRRSAPLVP